MLKHFVSRQFAGFLLVGGVAALVNWIARIMLSLALPYSGAVVLAYAVGMTVAFMLNRHYIFPASDKPMRKQARDFFVINVGFFPVVWVASLMLNKLLKQFSVEQYSEEIAHAIALSLPALGTFLLYKFFAFREKYNG